MKENIFLNTHVCRMVLLFFLHTYTYNIYIQMFRSLIPSHLPPISHVGISSSVKHTSVITHDPRLEHYLQIENIHCNILAKMERN